jgi:hypothetical protein
MILLLGLLCFHSLVNAAAINPADVAKPGIIPPSARIVLECGDRSKTAFCLKSPHDYSCYNRKVGPPAHKDESPQCTACKCKEESTQGRPPFPEDNSDAADHHKRDTASLALDNSESTSTKVLACDTRERTVFCASKPYEYRCEGKLKTPKAHHGHSTCMTCRCRDYAEEPTSTMIRAVAQLIRSPMDMPQCFVSSGQVSHHMATC